MPHTESPEPPVELAGSPGDVTGDIENVQNVAPKVRRSSHTNNKDSSPVKHSAIKYGELVILGYNGFAAG